MFLAKARSPTVARIGRLNRALQTQSTIKSPLAFAFDIDGVLMQGPNTIPGARKALRMVEGENSRGLKIPYILLTNGGGRRDLDRSLFLSSLLDANITPHNLIQAHTILIPIAATYGHWPALVLGGELDSCRIVAESYGFRQAYLPIDYLAEDDRIWPFWNVTAEERAVARPGAPHPKFIICMHDPRNWALEIQLCCDFLTHPTLPPPKVIFCNPDLLWRTDYERLRFGQGAFKAALSAVYKAKTGKTLEYLQFGKPTRETYQFAEAFLMEQAGVKEGDEMPRVYMIGDNPESDIAGANAYGWDSILVRTGVYDQEEDGPPVHQPTRILEDVEKAVEWAIEREFAPLGEPRVRGTWHGFKGVIKLH